MRQSDPSFGRCARAWYFVTLSRLYGQCVRRIHSIFATAASLHVARAITLLWSRARCPLPGPRGSAQKTNGNHHKKTLAKTQWTNKKDAHTYRGAPILDFTFCYLISVAGYGFLTAICTYHSLRAALRRKNNTPHNDHAHEAYHMWWNIIKTAIICAHAMRERVAILCSIDSARQPKTAQNHKTDHLSYARIACVLAWFNLCKRASCLRATTKRDMHCGRIKCLGSLGREFASTFWRVARAIYFWSVVLRQFGA